MSIMVFSERRRAAPSLIIRRAAASSILPSRIKCCFRTSGRGDPVRSSKTSATVILCDGGNGTSNVNKTNATELETLRSSVYDKILNDKKIL